MDDIKNIRHHESNRSGTYGELILNEYQMIPTDKQYLIVEDRVINVRDSTPLQFNYVDKEWSDITIFAENSVASKLLPCDTKNIYFIKYQEIYFIEIESLKVISEVIIITPKRCTYLHVD